MKTLMKKIVIFCWLFNAAAAAGLTADQSLVQLLQLNTYQASFVSYEMDGQHQVMKQKGQFYLKKNQGVRWEVNYPTEQVIVLSGQVLRIWDVDLMQISDQSVDQAFNPSVLLDNQDAIHRLFTVSGHGTSFTLIPIKKMSFKSIRLDFNHEKQMVQMMIDTGVSGGELFKFSHILIDQPIKNSQFHIRVPKGVEYINRIASS